MAQLAGLNFGKKSGKKLNVGSIISESLSADQK